MSNILHIVHPWGGGISTYIDDLKQASIEGCNIITMKCWQGLVYIVYEVDGKSVEKEYYLGKDLKLTDFTNKKYSKILVQVLDKYDINIVHIDSPVGHTFDIIRVPKLKNIPIICTIHDYFYMCPTFHLVDNNGDYCDICNKGEENHNCLKNHPYLYSEFDGYNLGDFRKQFSSYISYVDAFVFPTIAAQEIFANYYHIEEAKCRVIYHGTGLIKKQQVLPVRHDRNFRVGILGSMLKHKGKASIEAIMSTLETCPIEFYHFGDGALSGGNLITLGRYEKSNILDQLQSNQIDIILLLSTWPETFSYTLTESIAANIPVIATNKGALAERVSDHNIGWLVDYKDVSGICDLILKLSREDSDIEQYKQRIRDVKLKTLSEMNSEYKVLYDSLLSSYSRTDNMAVIHSDIIDTSGFYGKVFMCRFAQLTMIKARYFIYLFKIKFINFISKT